MWFGSKDKKKTIRAKAGAADTLITQETKIDGDVRFTGVLYVDGHIKGNVCAEEYENSLLTIGVNGFIDGDVQVPHIVVFGRVRGDVHAGEHIELQAQARIEGNVYYQLIEMAMGAEVNGKLVHSDEKLKLSHDKDDTGKVNAHSRVNENPSSEESNERHSKTNMENSDEKTESAVE